jgi:hypothetical protein
MRIGLDFDNTIACYDGVFHAAALERGLIAAELGTDKNSVRDFLNGSGDPDAFTELQGHVYGTRMDLAFPYEGVAEFVREAAMRRHELFIVSHKTRHPMIGPRHDLHAAARGFLEARGFIAPDGVPADRVFFELTKAEKLARIAALGCDVFIDDLPELIADPAFPPATRAILFDPAGKCDRCDGADAVYRDWRTLTEALKSEAL